ncbi:hypothetical protein BSQ38_01520 [Pediococcus damnosus]|uniref:glycosyltransferase family 2 protein n=1 Tax=Pediococcus damnosus TaxID=51663 RepID=UPI000C1CA785|nr:glycosyltransferase family 2 protein [Pediococcus damnosus]PIO80418.1 hypothetical protein BSQ38_01520 [Pediococcus damnosus]
MQYDATIIVPVYNGEKTLNKFLNSLEKQQTIYKYLIVLIDDGSKDKSIEIIKQYQNIHNNILLVKEKNAKQAVARNNGLNYVSGRYVFFLDCDDFIEKNMLQEMISKMDQGYDLVICGIIKHFYNKVVSECHTILTGKRNQQSLIYDYLTKNKEMDVGLWNKAFRTAYIKKYKLTFSNKNFFEDSLFVLEYIMLCDPKKISSISTPLYHLIKHNGTTTTTFNKDIDILSIIYMEKVTNILHKKNIVGNMVLFNAFKIRTILYGVNHHIKYDKNWTQTKQKRLLSSIKIVNYIKSALRLPLRYKMGSLMARFMPIVYLKLYVRRTKN